MTTLRHLSMPSTIRRAFVVIGIVLLAGSLGGCGSISSFLAGSMGDFIPKWAGGLPADAPPRPNSSKYDEWVKQHEPNAGAIAGQPDSPQATSQSSADAIH